ncbi:uncharacterized protein LOC124303421 [Neodiprion virginianus]|nr:uncharacterized protein LOC124303421 [Neodiprion virginianus]
MPPKAHKNAMAIVQFTDGIVYICKLTDISVTKKNHHAVRYKDRKKYAAHVLILSANLELLNEVLQHLQTDLPHVHLEKVTYTGTRSSSSRLLQQAKSNLEDGNKLFVNEDFLPDIDSTENGLFCKFSFRESSTDAGKDSFFLEADVLKAKQVSELRTTQSKVLSSLKPRVVNIETVNYDLLRAPSRADNTYTTDGFSSFDLEENRGQDIHVHRNSVDDLLNMSMEHQLDNMISSNDYPKAVKSPQSFDLDNPPPLSSTVIESTVSHIATDIIEDETFDDYLEKDKDYQVIEESDTTDSEESIESPSHKSEEEPITFTFSNKVVSAPDDINLIVDNSSTSTSTKKYFCLYCHKMQTKLARHLETVHSNEADVKKFIGLPKGNSERQEIIATLRKHGNHILNTDRRFNNGSLLVCRRPNPRMKKTAKDFIPCAKCKGQYAKSVIRHHWRHCTKLRGENGRIIMVKGRAIMARIHEKAEADVIVRIFAYMREDDIVRTIRYDELIILFANKQYESYSVSQHFFPMIRARLRLLGRFLVAIKRINAEISDFASIYKPGHYDNCIVAVKEVAEYEPRTRKFLHPTVASTLGTLLKQVGEILRSKYIKSEDVQKQKQVEDFLKLHSEDYGTSINKAVTETRSQNIRRKKVQLPSTTDIKILQDYLKIERAKYTTILEKKFCYTAWQKLAEVTLVSLQIFNRRRPGEIERLQIEDFETHEGMDSFADKEVFDSMTPEAQRLARNYVSDLANFMGHHDKIHKEIYRQPIAQRDIVKISKLLELAQGSTSDQRTDQKSATESEEEELVDDHCHEPSIECSQTSQDEVADCKSIDTLSKKATTDRKRKVTKDVQDEDSNSSRSSKKTTAGSKRRKVVREVPDEDFNLVTCSKKKTTAGSKKKVTTCTAQSTDNEQSYGSTCSSTSRRSWTNKEQAAVLKPFRKYLTGKKLPSLSDIGDVIAQNECLHGRTAPQVKTWIHNERKKMYR